MEHFRELETEKVSKLLIRYSLPPIIGMVAFASYNIVDRLFVGKALGADGISAVMFIYPMMNLFLALGMLTGIGAAALVSIKLGEKDHEYAAKTIGNALSVSTIITLLIVLFSYIFLDELIAGTGAEGTTAELAKNFVTIILAGAIFGQTSFTLNSMIRALGSPKTAMYTMLLSTGMNIILNPLLIVTFNMGIRGSALATVISQIASCIWVISFYAGKRNPLRIKPHHLIPDFKIIRRFVSIGMSSFVIQIGASLVAFVFNHLLMEYGASTNAIYGVAMAVIFLSFVPLIGLNQGAQPIIGFNLGAKRYDRVGETLKLSLITGVAITTIGFIGLFSFSEGIVHAFNIGNDLVEMGSRALRIMVVMFPLVGLQFVASNYFQSIGQSLRSVILTLLRQMIILIPLLLILPKYMGIDGIWTATPVADFISTMLAIIFLVIERKKLKAKSLTIEA